MRNIETSKELIETDKYIDYLEIKKFRRDIKKANLTQLSRETDNIKKRKELLKAKIEECDQRLAILDIAEHKAQTFMNDITLCSFLAGGMGGVAVAMGLKVCESLTNVANTTQIEILQQMSCIGAGILAGYAVYKLTQEKKDKETQNKAIQNIQASKEKVNKEKAHLRAQIEVENFKANLVSDMVCSKSSVYLK